jgi:hypothetical protein
MGSDSAYTPSSGPRDIDVQNHSTILLLNRRTFRDIDAPRGF